MIIKGIDTELNKYLFADVNPIKNDIKILDLDTNKKISLEIYSIPSYKLTFRMYNFPIKNEEYLEKALKTQLELDLPIPLEEIEFRYISKKSEKNISIFCVIAKKEDLKDFPESSVVDTEIFSLLRLAKFNNIKDGIIYHFTDRYVLKIKFKEYFPEEVRVLDKLESIEENAYLSGKLEKNQFKILNNPTGSPINNVAFGLLLKPLYSLGVDFLKKDNLGNLENNLKALGYITLSLLILNLVFFINLQVKKYELKKIKEKEKEIFHKYWNYSGKIYSPLTQAKGILKTLKFNKNKNLDSVNLLEELGKTLGRGRIEKITKLRVSKDNIYIKGIAKDENQFNSFKTALSKRFIIEDEKISSTDNKLSFEIKGRYE